MANVQNSNNKQLCNATYSTVTLILELCSILINHFRFIQKIRNSVCSSLLQIIVWCLLRKKHLNVVIHKNILTHHVKIRDKCFWVDEKNFLWESMNKKTKSLNVYNLCINFFLNQVEAEKYKIIIHQNQTSIKILLQKVAEF